MDEHHEREAPGPRPEAPSERVTVYEWVSEGGPGGACQEGLLRREGRLSWLFCPVHDAHDVERAEAAWDAPGRSGWEPFHGPRLQPGVVARAWRYCVEPLDTFWWEALQPGQDAPPAEDPYPKTTGSRRPG